MQQIFNFFIRNKNFFLFLLLFTVGLGLTIQSHTLHSSKFINSANWLTGGVYNSFSDINSYLGLKTENEKLQKENALLKQLLYSKNYQNAKIDSLQIDSTTEAVTYQFKTASVINNSYSLSKNYITINLGEKNGVTKDMGVISPLGIVGIINSTNSKYSAVQSIQNTLSKINVSLKKTNHFGSLGWDTKKPNVLQLTDIPKNASIKKGDTIITGGMSAIFPKGIPVGTIQDYSYTTSGNAYIINVKLFNDMTRLDKVYVIQNFEKTAIDSLENTLP